jgi:uncharacterized protein YbdZ (MbtH family)
MAIAKDTGLMTKVSIARVSPLARRLGISLGLGLGILVVGAIAPPPAPLSAVADTEALASLGGDRLVQALEAAAQLWQDAAQIIPSDWITVTRYGINATCDGFIAQGQTTLDPDDLTALVGDILQDPRQTLDGLELSGYRVQRSPGTPTVTIDFRINPDSPRQLVSLSSCEQMILLGSLRKTLLDNPELGIDTVRFSDRGEPIQL